MLEWRATGFDASFVIIYQLENVRGYPHLVLSLQCKDFCIERYRHAERSVILADLFCPEILSTLQVFHLKREYLKVPDCSSNLTALLASK